MSLHLTGGGNQRTNPRPNSRDVQSHSAYVGHAVHSVNFQSVLPTSSGNVFGLGPANYRMILSGTMNVTALANANTQTTLAHNLGYSPLVIGSVNNSTVSGFSFTGPVDVPLPSWLSANRGSDLSGVVTFPIYASMMVDQANVYVTTINASNVEKDFTVTFYLFQQGTQT